jgi:hypothetical protein
MNHLTQAVLNIGDVSHAIQLALAPVFLLTGIAGLLNVMAARLSRIIDRGRKLTEQPLPIRLQDPQALQVALDLLERRRHLASVAITACTSSALLVCTVVTGLFLEVLLQVEFRGVIGFLFMAATMALVVGLAYFLREVHLATTAIRIRLHVPPEAS